MSDSFRDFIIWGLFGQETCTSGASIEVEGHWHELSSYRLMDTIGYPLFLELDLLESFLLFIIASISEILRKISPPELCEKLDGMQWC